MLSLGLLVVVRDAQCAPATPVLEMVFPPGGQAGQTVDLTLTGKNLSGLRTLDCSAPGVRCEVLDSQRVRLTIPADTAPGLYDLWAVSDTGASTPRSFLIGNRLEMSEAEPNESLASAVLVPLNSVINGRISQAGDVDYYRFEARRGDRLVIECWAERIDSRLRPTLEVFDSTGRRLAVNRGYFGTDPLIDLRVPADGAYVVRVQDLILSGSAEHLYRLDLDTGPRVAFSIPSVVERDKSARVTFFGWNLAAQAGTPREERESALLERSSNPAPRESRALRDDSAFEQVEVEIPSYLTRAGGLERVRRSTAQASVEGFAYQYPGSHFPVAIGVTDVPALRERSDNHSPDLAQPVSCPCEVSGQIAGRNEQDWYVLQALRGEVLYFEVFADRIGSPVDLQLSVRDAGGRTLLARFGDDVRTAAGPALSVSHLDPSGRWVAPADGRYLLEIRNLAGGTQTDPRRTYRLSVRREEPDFTLVASPRRDGAGALNLARGGREALDVIVLRRRGLEGSIRISARDLPAGIECPDVWLGPEVDVATVVVSADRNAEPLHGALVLEGHAEGVGRQSVRWANPVRSGGPVGAGRLVSRMPLTVSGEAPLRISADGHEPLQHQLYGKLSVRHSPGGVVDLAVRIERADPSHQAPVKLIGIGLPAAIRNATATVPAGAELGRLSFVLPPTLAAGKYSLSVAAETTVPAPDNKSEPVTVWSNPVVLDVQPAAFSVEIDPYAPTKARRGETIQVKYSVQRRNGFIGKVHTELASPGRITDVPGLRGRGETFVGQTDRGMIQIVVNDDAPLGKQPFLRLFSVGVLEDEPIYQGADLFPLEITD